MAYVSDTEVRRYAPVTASDLGLSDSEFTTLVDDLLADAKSLIDTYCRRTDGSFKPQTGQTVTLDGSDAKRVLRLPDPVQSVTAVRVNGDAIPADTYEWKESGQLIRTGGSDSRRFAKVTSASAATPPRRDDDPSWPDGYGNVEVDLDYGHSSPPDDVSWAQKQMVANALQALVAMRNERIQQIDDFEGRVNMRDFFTQEIKNALDKHRRVEVFG